jgi:hypothetical protein
MNPASFGTNNLFGASMARQQAERAQVNNDINQEGALQELFQNEQMNPLEVQQQRLRNQGLEAGLPGIFADSEGRQLDTRKKRETIDSDIEAHVRNNYASMTQSDANALTAQGQQFIQFAEAARNGLSLADMSRLPPHLAKLLATPEGVEKVRLAGEGMMRGAAGVQGKLAEQEAKAAAAQELERLRQEGRMALQQARGMVQKAVAEAKGEQGAKSLMQLAANIQQKMYSIQDPDTRADMQEEVNKLLAKHEEIMANVARAGKTGSLTVEPDTGALATRPAPTQTPIAPSNLNLAPNAAPADKPARQAVSGVPQGAVDYLKANPTLTKEFDAKYGEGMAAKILSGK